MGGGWLAWWFTGSLSRVFAALALAMVIYGGVLVVAIARRVWFPGAAVR